MSNIHEKWVEWLAKMDTHLKRDVYLYHLKNIYEKTLENPRTSSPKNQEGMGSEGLGDLDVIFTYIYEYDGGVIGRGGHYKVLEKGYCDKNGVEDIGNDENDENNENNENDEGEEKTLSLIKEIYDNDGKIRIGLYTQRICPNGIERYQPSYYMISSNSNENPQYYTKCDFNMYDSEECSLFYEIRYGISSETYYILSGMSEWEPEVVKNEIDISEPSPFEMDEVDQLRYHREYMEGVDLDEIRNAISCVSEDLENDDNFKKWSSLMSKYGLCNMTVTFIKEGKL